jgi:hypothetical protein
VLGAITHLLFDAGYHKPVHADSADVEGAKVVLSMLAAGSIFVLVIAVGELSHHVARAKRRRNG